MLSPFQCFSGVPAVIRLAVLLYIHYVDHSAGAGQEGKSRKAAFDVKAAFPEKWLRGRASTYVEQV